MSTAGLQITQMSSGYGKTDVLHNINLTVNPGEIVTVIGSNGAGKSTTLRTISGLVRPTQGQTTFEGIDLARMEPDRIVRSGIVHVPEGRRIFSRLTVLENLEMGAYIRRDPYQKDLEQVYEFFPILSNRLTQKAGTLSGGEQQMLAIGRALLTKPKLLLLDEPSLGLAPLVVQDIFRIIRKIQEEGIMILLVEQNALQALKLANRAYVLETGRVVLEGPAEELLVSPQIQKSYLGQSIGRAEEEIA